MSDWSIRHWWGTCPSCIWSRWGCCCIIGRMGWSNCTGRKHSAGCGRTGRCGPGRSHWGKISSSSCWRSRRRGGCRGCRRNTPSTIPAGIGCTLSSSYCSLCNCRWGWVGRVLAKCPPAGTREGSRLFSSLLVYWIYYLLLSINFSSPLFAHSDSSASGSRARIADWIFISCASIGSGFGWDCCCPGLSSSLSSDLWPAFMPTCPVSIMILFSSPILVWVLAGFLIF